MTPSDAIRHLARAYKLDVGTVAKWSLTDVRRLAAQVAEQPRHERRKPAMRRVAEALSTLEREGVELAATQFDPDNDPDDEAIELADRIRELEGYLAAGEVTNEWDGIALADVPDTIATHRARLVEVEAAIAGTPT